MTVLAEHIYEIVRRAICAIPELTAELDRRGMFLPEERAQLLCALRKSLGKDANQPLGSVQFVTLLSQGDAQLAAAAVLRNTLTLEELEWLDRLLRFKKANDKRDELVRIVERALEKGGERKCPPSPLRCRKRRPLSL